MIELGPRVAIIGNSGSGKSTLAKALGAGRDTDVIDLDHIHWLDRVGSQRDESEATAIVTAIAQRPHWIIEGVYGWLVAPSLLFATSLVWLDMPWSVCSASLAARGPWAEATANEHAAFLAWAEAYWQRQTSSSFGGHLALYDRFSGAKIRLQRRSDVDDLITPI